ncbi:MAG TPA: serine/threonine protein kinase, partial [Polyangiaceae bacterium]|nr:serine/threonine protein kinase [Polyangiaceae bacterium]
MGPAVSRRARRRATPEIPPGIRIAGRYQIELKLGEGGMAEVYRALDVDTGRRVAIKILRSEIVNNREAVERTKREGELLSGLNNPAIVQVESYGELDDGAVFLVMELLEGETLGARMRRGAMEPIELAPIVAGTCAGLSAAHARDIVHRDLKPDNIFLCPTHYGVQVKLLDFGISKVCGAERLTKTGEVLGTPRYMSPEQLGAEHDVDGRADVYALGVILYEALAHKPPFLASTPTDLIIAILNGKVAPLRAARPDVSSNVEGVVMRAMSKLREARFDTAKDLAEAYIEAAGGVASVRRQQRRGLATRALGGKVAVAALAVPTTSPPPKSEGSVAGALRLGTFSGLREMPAAAASSASNRSSSAATRMMGAAASAAGIAAELPARELHP